MRGMVHIGTVRVLVRARLSSKQMGDVCTLTYIIFHLSKWWRENLCVGQVSPET